MTEQSLEKLLSSLADDRERSAELYVHLQSKLIHYFSWNGCPSPDVLADEVLDRFARRLQEGEKVEKPVSYLLGVARRVLLEARPRELLLPMGTPPEPSALQPGESADPAMDCLDRCMAKLPPESRAFLLEYYSAETSARILVRQRMADRLGLSINALRNRALRLRQNLEICVARCLSGETREEKP